MKSSVTVCRMKVELLDVQMTFRATRSEQLAVKKLSEREDRSEAQVIRRLFRRGLAQAKIHRKARQLIGSK